MKLRISWRRITWQPVAAALLLLTACAPSAPRNTGVYLLLDTSGTYTTELKKAEHIVLYMLSRLEPADSLAVARIDTGSFSEKDIVAKATFDDRPSQANRQKRSFAGQIQEFVRYAGAAPYTDITGGLLQAVEFLNEKGAGRKAILIFSDLKEDLAAGYVRNVPLDLKGFEVVALNVTKLRSDNFDPNEYMARVDHWRTKVEGAGGTFRMINDLERLEGLL
jgi:hypothetical protein